MNKQSPMKIAGQNSNLWSYIYIWCSGPQKANQNFDSHFVLNHIGKISAKFMRKNSFHCKTCERRLGMGIPL